MAENDLTTKAPVLRDLPGESYREDLVDVLYCATHGLQAFNDLIASDDYNDLCLVFEILIDRLKADLDKAAKVITSSLGPVEIEIAQEMIRRDGQTYNKGDFMRASIETGKGTAPAPERLSQLMIEVMEDVSVYEKKQKIRISNEQKAQLISELVNSCINRGVAYKNNPLRKVLLSLPWKEKEKAA